MSFSPEFFDVLIDKLEDEYFVYKNSFHSKNDRVFFLCRRKTKKFFCEVSHKKDFILGNFVENIIEEKLDDKSVYIGLFECNIENSKKIALTLDQAKPGTKIYIDINELLERADKNKFNDNVVAIDDLQSVVIVRIRDGKGYAYSYFSNLDVAMAINKQDGKLNLEVSKQAS